MTLCQGKLDSIQLLASSLEKLIQNLPKHKFSICHDNFVDSN